MDFDDDDLSVFGAPPASTPPAEPAAVLPPDAPPSDASTPAPVKKKAPLIAGECGDCGATVDASNGSHKRGGGWKHTTGCTGPKPQAALPLTAAAAVTQAFAELAAGATSGTVPTLKPAPVAAPAPVFGPPATVIEFGPETRALLEKLIKALSV